MSDTPVPEVVGRKISATFERKLDLGSYQNVVARAWVEDSVPDDATDSQVAEALNGLFTALKASVFDQLGIEFICDENGVMREKHEPVVTVERAAANVSRQLGGGALKIMNERDSSGDIPTAVVEACVSHGITAVWDNRNKGKGFREGVARGAVSKVNGTSSGAYISVDGTVS